MAELKAELKKKGITKDSLEHIVSVKILDYDIELVDRGPEIRSNIYKILITPKEKKEKIELIAKEYPNENTSKIDPSFSKSKTLAINEPYFHSILTRNGGYVPKFYDVLKYNNGEKGIFLFMGEAGNSAENKFNEINSIIKHLKKESNEESGMEIATFHNKTYDILRRAIDVYVINNKIIEDNFKIERDGKSINIYEYNPYEPFIHFYKFVNFVFREYSDEENLEKWKWKYDYKKMCDCIEQDVSKYLEIPKAVFDNEKEKPIVLLDLLPSHILLRNGATNTEYDNEMREIIGIKDNNHEKSKTYRGFSITDYDKVGHYPRALPIAKLLNHPSVTKILPYEKRMDVVNHAVHAYCASKFGKKLSEEDTDFRAFKGKFLEEFGIASIAAILHNLFYEASVHARLKAKSTEEYLEQNKLVEKFEKSKYKNLTEEFAAKNPMYEPKSFITENINTLLSLPDPNSKFSILKEGMAYIPQIIKDRNIYKEEIKFKSL